MTQLKKPPPKKKMKCMTQEINNAKDQVERENADAAAEAECTLVEAVAQEIERRSMNPQQQRSKPTGWYSSARA